MKFIITILFFVTTLFGGIFLVNASVAGDALDQSTPDNIKVSWEYIKWDTEGIWWAWWAWVSALLINIWRNIWIPVVIVVGLLIGIIAIYRVMFTEDEAERKKALWFFTYGVIGILIMFSAMFMVEALVWKDGLSGIIWEETIKDITWGEIANNMYDTILKPFVSIFMYLMIWILFIILLLSVIKFFSTPDKEETLTGAKTIMIWNVFGILVILSASSLVKLVYGWPANSDANDLWSVSTAGALNTKDISWLHNIINYFIWFIALLITVFIIYQAYRLLMKPDDEETLNALKRNFVYVLLGLLLMGGVYIMVNFIIV